jgi:hypothetical protein
MHRAILLAAFIALPAHSLAAPQTWVAWIDPTVDASPWYACADESGGQFVVGLTDESLAGPHQGEKDFWVARVSSAGSLMWVRQYGTPHSENPGSVCTDGAGGCYFSISTKGALGAANPDATSEFVLGHLDGAGNLLWMKQFPTAGDAAHPRLAPTAEGGVFAAGVAFGPVGGPSLGQADLWMMRIDAGGTLLWSKQFGTPAQEWIGDLERDGQGGTYLLAETEGALGGPSLGYRDMILARFDGQGDLDWIVQDGTEEYDYARGLVLDVSLAVYATGWEEGGEFGGGDAYLAKYLSTGEREWKRQVGSSGSDHAVDVVRDGHGGAFVVGLTDGDLGGPAVGGWDGWAAQFRSDGTLAWIDHAGTPWSDSYAAVSESAPGSFEVAGSTQGDLFGGPANGISKTFVAHFEACGFGPPTSYCPGSLNSTGTAALLADQGSTSIVLNDLRFTVVGGPPGEKGVVIVGTHQAQVPFGNGTLCLGGSVQRILPAVTLSAEGKGIHQVDFEDPSQPTAQITPGSTWYFQFWYRDSAAGIGDFNLSNGLSATFCP